MKGTEALGTRATMAHVGALFDAAARIGGEEFAVLAANSDEHGAYMLAERIRTEVEQAVEELTGEEPAWSG